MLKFKVKDQEFCVQFQHTKRTIDELKKYKYLSNNHHIPKNLIKNPVDGYIRSCIDANIYLCENNNLISIGHGWSVCSPLDRFNAKKGRKIALQRAVKDNREISKNDIKKQKVLLDKETSVLFWKTFFETSKDGLLQNGKRILVGPKPLKNKTLIQKS